MRLEFLDKVKDTDILGKTIFNGDGNILLRAGVRLNSGYITRLKKLGVFYVFVEDERLDDIPGEDSYFVEIKHSTMKSMSKVFANVTKRPRDIMKDSLNAIEDLVEHIIETDYVTEGLMDIRTYDDYTFVHCLDTCIMSTVIGVAAKMDETSIKELGVGAILHDIGKTKISSKIINKQQPLSQDEFAEIRKHPIYGSEILKKDYRISETIIDAVLQHHERVDGTGYPFGLKASSISKYAKVVCLCDTYDAVSNDRIYRKKFSPSDAYELILAGSGSIFDEGVVNNFRKSFSVFPLGCCLKLSSGEEGYVVRQNENFPDRPVVRVIYDYSTKEAVPFYEINLLKNANISVTGLA